MDDSFSFELTRRASAGSACESDRTLIFLGPSGTRITLTTKRFTIKITPGMFPCPVGSGCQSRAVLECVHEILFVARKNHSFRGESAVASETAASRCRDTLDQDVFDIRSR